MPDDVKDPTADQAAAFHASTAAAEEHQLTGVAPAGVDDADLFMSYYRQHPGADAHWIGSLIGWTVKHTNEVTSALVDSKHLVHDGNPRFLRLTAKGLKVK